jgi:hypothetical protein
MGGHISRSTMRTSKVENAGCHWHIIAMTESLKISNVHWPFEISIVMSGAVPFILQELADRKNTLLFATGQSNPHPHGTGRFTAAIPEFAHFNPNSPN